MSTDGIDRIASERRRQIQVEGWTAEHDDEHDDGELAFAAACYACPQRVWVVRATMDCTKPPHEFVDPWPWKLHEDYRRRLAGGGSSMPHDHASLGVEARISLLAKAGALIAAEIDRLLRLPVAQPFHEG
jgi:hypothetical protein